MKRFYLFVFTIMLSLGLLCSATNLAIAIGEPNQKKGPLKDNELFATQPNAVNEDHSGYNTWIRKWYGPDGNYTNNGNEPNHRNELIEMGTDGELTQEELSTINGLLKTKNKITEINWDNAHGGTREWTVFELNPADGNNMNRGGPADSIDTYGIIVIDAPKAMKSVMSPAHDNHAQIWINGEKWYNHPTWTGGAQKVHFNVEVSFEKGANVLLYRVTEGGGSAYMNLHFDDATHDTVDIYPNEANNKADFFKEVEKVLPVEPAGKLTTIWADIKRK
ncbi:MAG: hypothetical protein OXM61_13300 [Candidatus Poribacteria bacterium]|nr:hypothetical protein [Candidatus Poribacteria bacterium]